MGASDPLEDLADFLVSAKRKTYAAGGSDSEMAVQPLLPGSHQLEYGSGAFFYRDIYFGEVFFVGQETVLFQDEPIWAMCYAGGFTAALTDTAESGRVGALLQTALRQVAADRPFRGPSYLEQGNYVYADESEGDVHRFWGIETISRKRVVVYELRYNGGLLQ